MKAIALLISLLCIILATLTAVLAETLHTKIGVVILHPKWSIPAKFLSDYQHAGTENLFEKWP